MGIPTLTRIATAFSIAWLAASVAAAQTVTTSDAAALSLEDLLKVEVVTIASKFPQEVREAPASITVVTAAEIRRYGYRTLADVLKSVRGLYTTYDHNYSYAGIRGFSRPGDYNTRVLLLVDGNRLNDPIWDMAPIGTDFPIDISLVDKVEVIRGPASSLYGTNAFFAVINVVTRTGAQHAGLRAETFGGSLGTRGGTLSYGRVFGGDGELLLAGTAYQSNGAGRIRFPEFETEPGTGIAVDMDDDEAGRVFGSLKRGHFSLRGGVATRLKQVPTAAYGTVFGDQRLATRDTRSFLGAAFDGPIGGGWNATARVSFDTYLYRGAYPYDDGEGGASLFGDDADSRTLSSELTVRRRLARRHLLTAGAEVRNQLTGRMTTTDAPGVNLIDDRPGVIAGLYAQDEVRVFDWLLVNAGVRVDRHPSFGSHVTPRAGIVLLPRPQTAVKLLHGSAFRAPNPYELSYYAIEATGLFALDPEQIRSTEVVWEEYLSTRVRTTLSAYTYKADGLVEQRSVVAGSDDLYFVNAGRVEASGVEGEVEVRLPRGINAHVSHAYARARDVVENAALSNSPRNLSKFGVQLPLARVQLAVEGQYIGRRNTLSGDSLDGVWVPNVTLLSQAGRRTELSLSIYNAFDRQYGDPGAEEHLQRSIPQDGRTVLAKARIRF